MIYFLQQSYTNFNKATLLNRATPYEIIRADCFQITKVTFVYSISCCCDKIPQQRQLKGESLG